MSPGQEQGLAVVANPLADNINVQITNKLVEPKEVSFHFRVVKEERVIDGVKKDIKIGEKRASFKDNVPLLTRAGAIAALSAGDKSAELIVDAANDYIINRYRGLINDAIEADSWDPDTKSWKVSLSPEMFDKNKLSFLAIAMLPKSERGAGIAKETWAAFVADYKAVMASPGAISLFPDKKARSPEVLEKHGVVLMGKLNPVRSRKDVIQQMLGFLDIWAACTDNMDDHQVCFELLRSKGETLLQAENFDDL